jgi:hypothetical protein
MVWQKRVRIGCSLPGISKFSESGYLSKTRSIHGNAINVRSKVHADQLFVFVLFPDKMSACLEHAKLTELTTEFMEEEVEIEIFDGGVGTPWGQV